MNTLMKDQQTSHLKLFTFYASESRLTITLYFCLFFWRTAVIQHGIWDQLRVDHGTEFYLSLYVQENWRLIGPIQEECLSFKQHPSRCMLSQHNNVTLSLDRPIFYFLDKQFFCQTTCSLCSSVSDAFC